MERRTIPGPLAPLQRRVARAADWLRRRQRRGHQAHGIVLMYHRVATVPVDPWNLAVGPNHFDDQVRTLRRYADIVPLTILRDHLRTGRRTRPVVAITFDDGYVDNLETARPVLERYEAPATVFVASGYIGRSERFWWDRLAEAILMPASLSATLSLGDGENRFQWNDPRLPGAGGSGRRARRRLHDRLWAWFIDRPGKERSLDLENLEEWAGVRRHEDASAWPMTADQLRQLAAGGLVDVGAHSVTHPRLTALSRSEQQAEIVQSRRDCERVVGVAPRSFAFPNGDHDVDCIGIVREAGFSIACTSRPDLAWADGDAHATPRISVPDIPGEALWRHLRWRWLP